MMRRIAFVLGLCAALAAFVQPAGAVKPSEMLQDPVLEARARAISKDLRCLVCQNQSIDESEAELAGDLRVLVRERLVAGDSDEQVVDFVVARYGDFVLLDPPFKAKTFVLWTGPAIVLAAGAAGALGYYRLQVRRIAAGGEPALTAAERRRVDELLKG